MTISIDLNRNQVYQLFYWLLGFELCLLFAYLAESALGSPAWIIKRLLDLDGEQSIAVWFSVVQLAAIGVLFLIKAARTHGRDGIPRWFLLLGSAGFFFLSMDEHLELHESITIAMVHLDWMPRFSGDHGIWVFFYLGAGLLLVLLSIRPILALWHQYNYSFLLMAAGAGVFLLGAVGLEIIYYEFLRDGPRLFQVLEVAAEEFMEMLGATAILCGAAFYVLDSETAKAHATETEQTGNLKSFKHAA